MTQIFDRYQLRLNHHWFPIFNLTYFKVFVFV